jgi:uncharacterized membrane protein YkvI
MQYKKLSVWIFVLLLLLIALMIFFPNAYTIGIGTMVVPVLVIFQTYIILKAKDESKHSFQDKWYDDP